MVRADIGNEGVVKIGDKTITIDPAFNPYRYAVQVGEVVAVPFKIDRDFISDFEIKVSDKIHMHHFCISHDNAQEVNGEILYAVKYRDIYCVVRDGKILPCQDYVFLSEVLEDESNCKSKSGLWLKSTQDPMPLVGKVEATCKKAMEDGIIVGEHVRFLKNSDYEIIIENKKYYRMKAQRIIALVNVTSEIVS